MLQERKELRIPLCAQPSLFLRGSITYGCSLFFFTGCPVINLRPGQVQETSTPAVKRITKPIQSRRLPGGVGYKNYQDLATQYIITLQKLKIDPEAVLSDQNLWF